MRFQVFIAVIAIAFSASCNRKEENKKPIETAAPDAAAMLRSKTCYVYTKNNDTITMSLAMSANNANGELIYNLYQKDKNKGTFSGTFIGDTLFGDYTFDSEGTSSVREMVFLRRGNALTEGYGEMEERNGKTVFKDPGKLSFKNNIVLRKTKCR